MDVNVDIRGKNVAQSLYFKLQTPESKELHTIFSRKVASQKTNMFESFFLSFLLLKDTMSAIATQLCFLATTSQQKSNK